MPGVYTVKLTLADDDGAPGGGAEVTIGTCEQAGDDEDGVLFTAPLRQGSSAEAIQVEARMNLRLARATFRWSTADLLPEALDR